MNRKNRLFKKFFGLILLLGVFTAAGIAEAASIFDAPNASIPDSSEMVSSKYSFIAKFNKEKTKVTPFGEGWQTTKNIWGDGREEAYFSLRPQAAQKGKNGVIYSNVGSYKEKTIDLEITLKDWQQFSTYQGYISYSKEDISHFAQGYDFVDQEWAFIDQESGSPVKVSGFMTINDIDGGQGVQFSKETSAAIDKIYIATADNWINYENINGEYKFFDNTGTGSENEDLFAAFTFLYSEQSSFRFKWCVDKTLLSWDYETLNYEKDHADDAGYQGAYFGYIAKKPLKTEILSPIKKNSDSDETLVDKNTLIDRHEVQLYTVVHQVPDEYEEFYYNSYSFQDTLDPVFDIQNVNITDETGKDCTRLFDLQINGNEVSYTAKKEVLETAVFYGHYYTTTIYAKIRDEAELVFSDGVVLLNNTAKVTIDGTSKDSNKTVTEVHEFQLPKPVKRVVDETGKDINKKEVLPGETLIYEVDQAVDVLNQNGSTKYQAFSIIDDLPKQVSFQSAKILKDGKLIEAEKIHYDKEKHIVTFTGDAAFLSAMEMKGETYTLQIMTKVNEDVKDKEQIENTGSSLIDQEAQPTNKVENTTKRAEGSITINKVTKQLIGIKAGTELLWEKRPQQGVTYQVKAHTDILLPNGEVSVEAGHSFGEITTDKKGQASIKELSAGEYALVECAAPVGIQIATEPIIVGLKSDGENQMKVVIEQEDALQEVELRIHKVFEQGNGSFVASDGAVFGLYHGEDHKIDKDQIIKADTLVAELKVVKGLGTYKGNLIIGQQYYIKEISAKTGYQLRTEKFYFTYEPVSNAPVHKIELFENGLTENGISKSYKEKETESDILPKNMEMQAIKNRKITENGIIKSIITESGTEVDHYDLLKSDETIVFKGLAYIGSNEKRSPLQISDSLPAGFSYESSQIYDETGNDITEYASVATDGQQVVLTVDPEYAEQLNNSAISWMIKTTYKYSSNHQGQTFKNQLQLSVGGDNVSSNIVTLTPPSVGEKPFGAFPNTGELVEFTSLAGLCIVLFVMSYSYTKKSKEEL